MATVTSWVTKLRNRLGDSSTTGPFTTARLEDFCNDGLKDIARRLRPWLLPELHTVSTGDITAATLTTNSYFVVTSIDYSQIVSLSIYNTELTRAEEEQVVLVQDGYSYKQRRKRNVFWSPDNKQTFGYMEQGHICIEPDKGSFKYRLRYVKTPEFTTGNTDIPINDRWEDMLLDYGEGRARKLEHRDQESELAFQRYEQMIQQANGVEA
jgi:hypothetical protein